MVILIKVSVLFNVVVVVSPLLRVVLHAHILVVVHGQLLLRVVNLLPATYELSVAHRRLVAGPPRYRFPHHLLLVEGSPIVIVL